MPHPVCLVLHFHSDLEGLIIFGACAVVAVAVVVIEEWPNIKETYYEVRARRRRRRLVPPHQHYYTVPVDEQPLAASGIHEPVQETQEMSMRSRTTVLPRFNNCLWKDGKGGLQVFRPFGASTSEQPLPNNLETGQDVIIPPVRENPPTRFPIFAEDVSPLIHRTTSPLNIIPASPSNISNVVETVEKPELINPRPSTPELINPLDRPSTPDTDPFADPQANGEPEIESLPMSRTTSHTLSLHPEDDINSMSDWTEAFENQTESEGPSDVDSDSDVVSDAESEASWARVRSGGIGYN